MCAINTPDGGINSVVIFLPYWILLAVALLDCLLVTLSFYSDSTFVTCTLIIRLVCLISAATVGFISTIFVACGRYHGDSSTILYVAIGLSVWTLYVLWVWSYIERSLSEAESRGYLAPLRLEMTGRGWEPVPAAAQQRSTESVWFHTA